MSFQRKSRGYPNKKEDTRSSFLRNDTWIVFEGAVICDSGSEMSKAVPHEQTKYSYETPLLREAKTACSKTSTNCHCLCFGVRKTHWKHMSLSVPWEPP